MPARCCPSSRMYAAHIASPWLSSKPAWTMVSSGSARRDLVVHPPEVRIMVNRAPRSTLGHFATGLSLSTPLVCSRRSLIHACVPGHCFPSPSSSILTSSAVTAHEACLASSYDGGALAAAARIAHAHGIKRTRIHNEFRLFTGPPFFSRVGVGSWKASVPDTQRLAGENV